MPVRHEHGDDCVPCVTYRSVRAVVSSSDNEVLLSPQTSTDCAAGCPASLESSAAAAAHDQKASILACYVCKRVAGKLCNDTRAIAASNGKMCDFWTHFLSAIADVGLCDSAGILLALLHIRWHSSLNQMNLWAVKSFEGHDNKLYHRSARAIAAIKKKKKKQR